MPLPNLNISFVSESCIEAKITTLLVGNFCDLEPSVKLAWTHTSQFGNSLDASLADNILAVS